jgi:DNA-directed RNA polymerase subunit RPC12/RpoP
VECANNDFTLAEQELERKLRESPAKTAETASDSLVCSHCGSRVTAKVSQYPSCVAGLP